MLTMFLFAGYVVLTCTSIASSACREEEPQCSNTDSAMAGELESFASAGALNLLQTKMTLTRLHRQEQAQANSSSSAEESLVVYADGPDDWVNIHFVRPLGYNGYTSSFEDMRNKIRPMWAKSLRCDGPSGDNCEECTASSGDPIDCFSDCPITATNVVERHEQSGKCVFPSSGDRWKRFLFTVHFKCPVEMRASFRIGQVIGGTIRLLWDGKLLHSLDENTRPSTYVESRLKSSKEEGHSLSVEFTPYVTAYRKSAHFKSLEVQGTNRFSKCVDKKACLKTLATFGERGLRLKNSNDLLLRCLESPKTCVNHHCTWRPDSLPADLRYPCEHWRRCLWRTGSVQGSHLHLMLLAAGVDLVTGRAAAAPRMARRRRQMISSRTSKNDAEEKCFYPPNEDPVSWSCDCSKKMNERCEEIDARLDVCFRAQICLHPQTCEDWKTEACQTPQIRETMTKLQGEYLSDPEGVGYRGKQTKTRSGRVCQRWDVQSPHRHFATAYRYPNAGLTGNYCRNPRGALMARTIWCYTSDPGKRWEYCDPLTGSLLEESRLTRQILKARAGSSQELRADLDRSVGAKKCD
eukprot:gnl/TRDRNA2_/TRDRNA2_195850_c0_seq1.p1 gnl/TRDRNA2_/TRDRNA2_195850_c0~~gnl/TRDRNA2_/TRDRNA2_195850_c0_seq1.p1  ORF type:complete len:578 (+),score=52.95 gnl/TRDRNA2_/TRDRNA2_195850_c0_seq1:73-1806(+)